jgi:plastocyanin
MSKYTRLGTGPRLGATVMLAALFVALVLVALGCGANDQGSTTTASNSTGGAQVVMTGFTYDPATVTIGVGETVTWVNEDAARHDVIADNGEFASDLFGQGQSFSFTFRAAGSYPYHCGVHPGMTGTVIVQ